MSFVVMTYCMLLTNSYTGWVLHFFAWGLVHVFILLIIITAYTS